MSWRHALARRAASQVRDSRRSRFGKSSDGKRREEVIHDQPRNRMQVLSDIIVPFWTE